MAGLAPKLPLRRDEIDGYALIKNFRDLAQQNLKMLILTSPGERIMEPKFGVGLRRYLFNRLEPGLINTIDGKIRSQVGLYFPHMRILDIRFRDLGTIESELGNAMNINIAYYLTPLQVRGEFNYSANDLGLGGIPL